MRSLASAWWRWMCGVGVPLTWLIYVFWERLDILVVVGVVGLCAVFVYRLVFARELMITRQLRHVPCVAIAQFPEGARRKIVGRLVCLDTLLIAPLTGRRCAYYRVVVEEDTCDGLSTSIDHHERQDFILQDATGEAYVCMRGAHVAVTQDAHFRSGRFEDATPILERFLAQHDHRSTNWLGLNKALSYSEGILEAGEEVAVYGVGRWEDKPAPSDTSGSPHQPRTRLIMTKPDQMPLYISDDTRSLSSGL